jgi:hypothetical protein
MSSTGTRRVDTELRDLAGMSPHQNIHAINQLEGDMKERIYSLLIPDRVFDQFKIDRQTFVNKHGERAIKFITPRQAGFAIIEVREHPDDRDCIFFLELADTSFFKVEITFLIINNIHGPRFGTDIDDAGRRTKFGTTRRNIPEEIRAMNAGLAPGQVRPGLRLLKSFLPLFMQFLRGMNQDMVVAEPLTYHDAIIFEYHGFNYIRGRKKMDEINLGFQPGGELYDNLDGCTPFRMPGSEGTVRGRSWAIHDGILGDAWKDIEMYKSIDRPIDVCTFPGWVY